MKRTNPVKLMLRNLCQAGLTSGDATASLADLGHRIEVSAVDDLTLQVRLYGQGNPLPAYLTIKVTGNF